MRNTLLACAVVGGIGLAVGYGVSLIKIPGKTEEMSREASVPVSMPKPGWVYETRYDQMRGVAEGLASLQSKNSQEFSPPYSGGSRVAMVLRKKGPLTLITLHIDKGQFNCASVLGGAISVRFDAEEIESYRCIGEKSGNTGVIFLEEPLRFLMALRKSHALIVEASFFQEGNKQFSFDTGNLDWPFTPTEVADVVFADGRTQGLKHPDGTIEKFKFIPEYLPSDAAGNFFLISTGKSEEGCHACSGVVRIDMLRKRPSGSLSVVKSWPWFDTEYGTFGDPPEIKIVDDDRRAPKLQISSSFMAQGCAVSIVRVFALEPGEPRKLSEKRTHTLEEKPVASC